MDRRAFKEQLEQRLKIEKARDGVRLVTLDGVALGRLGRDADTGRWGLDWRAGWLRQQSGLESDEPEHAEVWALRMIADLMAIERQAIVEKKPWGSNPPPGVG